MVSLAIGLLLLAAFLRGARTLPPRVRRQRKPGAPAGCRAPRPVGAGAGHGTRRVLRLHQPPAARLVRDGTRDCAAGARCASRLRGAVAPCRPARGRARLRQQLRRGPWRARAGREQRLRRWASMRATARPPPPRVGLARGADTLTLRHASLATSRAARRAPAAVFATPRRAWPGRAVRRRACSGPVDAHIARFATSKCAPTTSPTIRWAAGVAGACASRH